MPKVVFTPHLKRYIECSALEVEATSVRVALEKVIELNPRLSSYVLDDQSRLRKHVMIFVDGKPILDRPGLGDPVLPDSEIYIMQALSGG